MGGVRWGASALTLLVRTLALAHAAARQQEATLGGVQWGASTAMLLAAATHWQCQRGYGLRVPLRLRPTHSSRHRRPSAAQLTSCLVRRVLAQGAVEAVAAQPLTRTPNDNGYSF